MAPSMYTTALERQPTHHFGYNCINVFSFVDKVNHVHDSASVSEIPVLKSLSIIMSTNQPQHKGLV